MGFFKPCHSVDYRTKFVPHKALRLIVWGKLTFDERAIPPPYGFERLVGAKVMVKGLHGYLAHNK